MDDHNRRLWDMLGPFVLGILDPEEERELQRHLEECPRCREEEAKLRMAHHDIGEATRTPPPELKARVMEGLPTRRRWRIRGALVAAVLLLVALLVGGIYSALLVPQDTIAATANLSPTERAPGANGEVRLEEDGANMQMRLEVSGLSQLRPDEYYELWFLKGEERISCGGFAVDSEGKATVSMNAPKAAYAGYPYVIVTKEKSTGDPLPSKNQVLGGEIRRT